MWREYVAYHVAASLIVGRSNSNGVLEKAHTSNILSSAPFETRACELNPGITPRSCTCAGTKKSAPERALL